MTDFHFDKCAWAETIRTPRLNIMECPECGNELEVFSIDFETKCDECGYMSLNKLEERIYWCAKNCPYADECIGKELNDKIVNSYGRISKAVYYFKKGFSCSSAVVHAYADYIGMDCGLALKLPSVFAAGMGMSETCGAVTGALMLIGAKFGKTKGYDTGRDKLAADHAKRFIKEFTSRNRYHKCKDLLGCDISEPEVMEEAWKGGLILNICPKLVRDAAEIIDKLIE